MKESDILELLKEKKTLDELNSELKYNKKKLKRKLKDLLDEGTIETDADYYWLKAKSGKKSGLKSDAYRYLPIIVLIGITLLGLHLRAYHIDYPVVGYHNWKEVNMLVKARYFAQNGFFEHGLFVPESGFPTLRVNSEYPDPSGAGKSLFPFMEIITALLFNIFGYGIAVARIVPVLFSVGTIPLVYFLIRRLSNGELISLTTALLVSVNPLLVFFGRNYQEINISLFFMVLAVYSLFCWRENQKQIHIILFAISLSLSTLTKDNFLITLAIISLAFFPYKRLKEKKYYKDIVIMGFILLSIPAWTLYTPIKSDTGISTERISGNFALIDSNGMFSEGFQTALWERRYIHDAFTVLGFYVIILGISLFIIAKIVDRKFTLLDKFLLVSLITLIIYVNIMAGKISGHVYHFYPIMPLALLFAAYFITSIPRIITYLFRDHASPNILSVTQIAIIALFLLILIPGFMASKDGMFNTQFPGLDIAGDYVKSHKGDDDRMLHTCHQAFGVLWHADLKGSRDCIPEKVEDIKFGEEERNVSWIFTYNFCYSYNPPYSPFCFDIINSPSHNESWNYVKENYSLKQIAFVNRQDLGSIPLYYLFEKGGSFDDSKLNEMLSGKPVQSRDYEYTNGIQRVYYVNLEE